MQSGRSLLQVVGANQSGLFRKGAWPDRLWVWSGVPGPSHSILHRHSMVKMGWVGGAYLRGRGLKQGAGLMKWAWPDAGGVA